MSEVSKLITSRVRSTWREEIAGQDLSQPLPWSFTVGKPTADDLDRSLGKVREWALGIETFAEKYELTVQRAPRRSSLGLKQTVPSRLVIDSFESAARVAGLMSELIRDRDRMAKLRMVAVPSVKTSDIAGAIHRIRTWSEQDLSILVAAVSWFEANPAAGMTAREVPVPGMNSKWLSLSRQKEIAVLLGLQELGLTAGRPQRANFRYLDTDHLAAGGRQFDVAAAGDVNKPAYLPQTVVICENVDSAQQLPSMPEAIVFEGDGYAGAVLISQLEWVQQAPALLYWGDMDVDGLAIVNMYRARGLAIQTLLMDLDAYNTYVDRGVSVDRRGAPLRVQATPTLPHLTAGEAALLEHLCEPGHSQPRRIEQEQLPRQVAVELIADAALDPGR
ncbi:Wadjet anti-phage system protein JetD domain-containing protein [Demequina aurantiaca]|uniref:Wadjet anti-phage system protein JetD domain-containing protein n=1 Tax=Demequina aurantiaca TaxID=676200 RepID=UPI003D3256D5